MSDKRLWEERFRIPQKIENIAISIIHIYQVIIICYEYYYMKYY